MKTCTMCKHFYNAGDWVWYEQFDLSFDLDILSCEKKKQEDLCKNDPEEDEEPSELEVSEWLAKAETCPDFTVE